MKSAHEMRRLLVILTLYAFITGYLEAATVTYTRVTYEAMHFRLFPDREPDDLMPLFSFEQWEKVAPAYLRSPLLEIFRETGTVVALGLVTLLVASTFRLWMATFFLMLGISGWSYYLWLKVMTGWPHTLSDWDLIFMVPIPMVSPVWAALVAYTVMLACAGWFFWSEAIGRPLHAGRVGWLLLVSGSIVAMTPFYWDVQHLLAGGYPRPFNAWVLAAGLLMVVGVLIYAGRRGRRGGVVL
jgi:hypothetical protein